jgi:hypothetical protein
LLGVFDKLRTGAVLPCGTLLAALGEECVTGMYSGIGTSLAGRKENNLRVLNSSHVDSVRDTPTGHNPLLFPKSVFRDAAHTLPRASTVYL